MHIFVNFLSDKLNNITTVIKKWNDTETTLLFLLYTSRRFLQSYIFSNAKNVSVYSFSLTLNIKTGCWIRTLSSVTTFCLFILNAIMLSPEMKVPMTPWVSDDREPQGHSVTNKQINCSTKQRHTRYLLLPVSPNLQTMPLYSVYDSKKSMCNHILAVLGYTHLGHTFFLFFLGLTPQNSNS